MTRNNELLRIGVDLDGVLADFNSTFIALIKQMIGIELPPVSDTYPDCWSYHRAGGVTKQQDAVLWAHISDPTVRFWRRLGELPGATMLRDLSDMMDARKVVVYFITTRLGASAHQQSMTWLAAHGFRAPVVLIAGSEDAKGKLALGLGLDAFIDDKPENCIQVKLQSPSTKVFILNAPYNKTLAFDGITRVWHVREMLEQVGLMEPAVSKLEQAINEQKAA